MHASVGDTLVVRSHQTDHPDRRGRIVRLHGSDGRPPYEVMWSDAQRPTLVFPGPDGHVEPRHHRGEAAAGTHPVRSWHVTIDLAAAEGKTSAHAVLQADSALRLEADGSDGADAGAAARALQHLSEALLATAKAAGR